jgi:hypothetical protein
LDALFSTTMRTFFCIYYLLLYVCIFTAAYTVHEISTETQYSCASLCFGDLRCLGYSENIHNRTLQRCIHVYLSDTTTAVTDTIVLPSEFHPIIHKNWSSIQTGTQLCFPHTRQCVMCSEYPLTWMADVGPGYTVYIIPTCTSIFQQNNTHVVWPFNIPPYGIEIPYPNIIFNGFETFLFNASTCPVFNVTDTGLVDSASINSLTLICPPEQNAHSSIHVANTARMALSVKALRIYNVITGIYMRGGMYGTTPTDEIDISNSFFSDIRVYGGNMYAGPYVLVLVSFVGNPVVVQDFHVYSKVMYAPYMDTSQQTAVTYIGTRPRVINESFMTDITRAGHQLVSLFVSNPLDVAYHLYVTILLIGIGILLFIIFIKYQAIFWPPTPRKIE